MPSRACRSGPAIIVATAALATAASACNPPAPKAPPNAQDMVRIHYDGVLPGGKLTGGVVWRQRAQLGDPAAVVPAVTVETIHDMAPRAGTPDNRIDLVFVGDGYAATRPTVNSTVIMPPDNDLPPDSTELRQYEGHVDAALHRFFQYEPFTRYKPIFRVHRVDVISNDSGVTNDPVIGVMRDTAMNMRFWCEGIEQLLCVNTSKAQQFANAAPALDIIIAVANSTKYGGAGYQSENILTISGGSADAFEITIHEMGHVLGLLADEYDTGGPVQWPGGEPFEANLSTFQAAQMLNLNAKWAAWIGQQIPGYDGPIHTYQGGGYSMLGIYRPSPDSAMRTLGKPFNAPSIESLVVGIYQVVDPIDSASPAGVFAPPTATLVVEPIPVIGAPLQVQWFLNGLPVSVPVANEFDLSTITLPPGDHFVTARVTDTNPWVISGTNAEDWLTEDRNWVVTVPAASPTNADGSIEGVAAVLRAFGQSGDQLDADLDGDGRVGLPDLLRALGARE